MPLSLVQQLEAQRLQGLHSSSSLNRYKLKQLQSLVPKCWNQIKILDDKFKECSTLFECPNLEHLADSNGFYDTKNKNVNYMTSTQLSANDKLIILFLDLALPYINKIEVQTLVWYLFYFYQSSARLSVYFLYYILPAHSTGFYSDFIINLTFPPNSSFLIYKNNTNPSREWITNATLKNFENFQFLSKQARRISLENDRDAQNSKFFSFFNSVLIEIFSQSKRLSDNQLRFFLINALEALKNPNKLNYYNTYLCGVSALLSKYNLTKNIQLELLSAFLNQFVDRKDYINSENALQTIVFISLFQYQHDEVKHLPHKWFNYVISNLEYQNLLIEAIKNLLKSEIEPVKFCQLLLSTALEIDNSEEKFIENSSDFLVKIIKNFQNKCDFYSSICADVNHVLILNMNNKLDGLLSNSLDQNPLKKRKTSSLVHDELFSLLEYFENWNNSTSQDNLLKAAEKILQFFPRYYKEILKSPFLWQFLSRLDEKNQYFIALSKTLSHLLNKIDERIIECLTQFLQENDKTNCNEYLLFEYALQPYQEEFFSCIDYMIQLSSGDVGAMLGPLAITLKSISSVTTNSNLLLRIETILNSLSNTNYPKEWSDVSSDMFKSDETFKSINILLEYIRFLSKNIITDSDFVMYLIWDYLRRLDGVIKLIRMNKITDFSVSFISILSSFLNIFCSFVESSEPPRSEKVVTTLIILACQNNFLNINLSPTTAASSAFKLIQMMSKNVISANEMPVKSNNIGEVENYSSEDLLYMTMSFVPPEVVYNKLLKFIDLDLESSSFCIIILFYFIACGAKNTNLQKPLLDFIEKKLKKKSSVDISKSMDLLVQCGFILHNPCDHGYRFPRSDVISFLQSLLKYNNNQFNLQKNIKELLKSNNKVEDFIFYISHFIPRDDSKAFRSLVNLSNINSTSTFNLVNMDEADVLYNVFSAIGDLYYYKAKKGNLSSSFIKKTLNAVVNKEKMHFLVSDVILSAGKYYDAAFNVLYKLIFEKVDNAIQLAPLLISLSSKSNINSDALIEDLEKSDGVLKSVLYIILLRAKHSEDVRIKLLNIMLEDKLEHNTYYSEAIMLFFESALDWSSSVSIAKLILANLKRLEELSKLLPGEYFDSSEILRAALLTLVSFPKLGSNRLQYRKELLDSAALFWANCPDSLKSTRNELLDHFICAKRILNGDLSDASQLNDLIALSALLLTVKFENFSSRCESIAMLLKDSFDNKLFAISSSPQVDCTTSEYKKIADLGDLLFFIISLFDKTNNNSLKKVLWSILGSTKLHLNLPHLILSILGYPFYYDLQYTSIVVDNTNISIVFQLFKILTNLFKNASLAVTSLEGLKQSEIKSLYNRIIYILTQLFPSNPHIILKSLIFLIKTKCSTIKSLQTMVFPLFLQFDKYPNTDINLLGRLIVFSASIPGIDVVFHEFGEKLFIMLIGITQHCMSIGITQPCKSIGEPLAVISKYIAIPSEISDDAYRIALSADVDVKLSLLESLSKSVTRKQISEFANTAKDATDLCTFFILATYYNNNKPEDKMSVFKNTLKAVVNSTPLDTADDIPPSDLKNILLNIRNQGSTFSLYYSLFSDYLESLINDFSITQVSTVLEQVKLTCMAIGKKDNKRASIYRQLYLCLSSTIVCSTLQDNDFLWIPILQQVMKVFELQDKKLYILSLAIIDASATCSVTYKVYEQLIEAFFLSLAITLPDAMLLWESILSKLLTEENYEVVTKRLIGEITTGNNKIKKLIISILINICNGARNNTYDICICEKLKNNLLSIKSTIKDISYDSDTSISRLASELYDSIQELVEINDDE